MNRAHYGVFSTALLSSISLFALNAATAQDASGGQDVIIADPVVISATRYETPIQEVGSAISVLDAEELSRRQFLRLEDALQLIPGVTVDLNGSPGRPSPVRLRGLGPRNTLVLVDGMEVADTSRSQVQFEFGNIPPETVERVEVLRGPQSALYGADSAGGVINIITRKPEEPFEAQARVEYGSFNTFKPFLEAGGRHESGFYALGSFSYTDIDGFSSFNEDRGGSEDDPYISRAWLGKAGKDFDNGASIELRGRYVDETTASDRNNADLIGVYIDKEEFYYGGTASLPLLDGRLVNQVTASYVEHERFFDGGFLNGDVYEGSKAKVDYLATFDFYEAHTTAFGIEWEEERLDQVAPQAGGVAFGTPADAAFLDEKVATVAAFAQHQWRPIEGLSLIAGIRADDNEKFGTDVTARGSIAYDIQATGTRLRASGGSGIVTPSLYELNDVCIGNADLDPEESVGFDVGVDQTALGGRADVSLTIFRTEVEDQIAYVSSPTDGTPLTPACAAFFGTFGGYQNFDEVRSQGAEFAGQMQVTDDLDVAVAYTFTDASITSRDRRLRDVPRHEGSFQVNWTGGAEGLTLGVDGRYRSNEDNFGGTSDSFFVARVRASYEVAGGGPEFFIRVENAFDEDYEESFGSGTPDRSVFGGVRVKY